MEVATSVPALVQMSWAEPSQLDAGRIASEHVAPVLAPERSGTVGKDEPLGNHDDRVHAEDEWLEEI